MCFDPISAFAAVSLVTTAIGGYFQYQGVQAQGKAEAAQLNYNAQVADNNAMLRRQDAARISAESEVAAQKEALKSSAEVSRARVAAAASGVDPNTGSPLTVQSDLAKLGKLDVETTRYNGLVMSRNALIEGQNQESQAGLLRAQGAGVKKQTKLAGYASLLSTASSISDKFAGFKSQGTFG